MTRVMFVLMAAVVVALASYSSVDAEPGVVDLVAVDTDPGGNEPTGPLGPVDGCREVAVGETFSVDVVVDEVDPADAMDGWQFAVTYDPSVLQVVGYDLGRGMLRQAGGPFVDFTNDVPDSDGFFLVADSDFGPAEDREFGEGILAGLTFESVGPGASGLGLDSVLIGRDAVPDPISIEPTSLRFATVISGAAPVCENFEADHDLDGICDQGSTATYCSGSDNCEVIANSDQADQDGDGLGDVCDICPKSADHDPFDIDKDGVRGCADVCPMTADPGQEDSDGDGVGDACEPLLAVEVSSVDCPTVLLVGVRVTCAVTLRLTNLEPTLFYPRAIINLDAIPNDPHNSLICDSSSELGLQPELQPLSTIELVFYPTFGCEIPTSGYVAVHAWAVVDGETRPGAVDDWDTPIDFEVVEGPAGLPNTGGEPAPTSGNSWVLLLGTVLTVCGMFAMPIAFVSLRRG